MKIADLFKPGNKHVYIVAEMSGNHGGKLDRAIEIVKAAHAVGADAIKLQTYTADTITLNSDREDFRLPKDSPWAKEGTLHELYEKAHTPWDWHEAIFAEARKLGMECFSSPFDETAVDFLENLKVPAYKIASPEINHIPLLKKVAKLGKPVILSTGVADRADIDLAVKTLKENGCNQIVILKCTTAYPAPIEESNLLCIPQFKKDFNCPIGLSDHAMGSLVAAGAVALGATMVEKHFTLDKDETVDSFFSMDTNEFKSLVDNLRQIELALGAPDYNLTPSQKTNLRGRRSLYISADVKSGETFSEKNIKCVRPSLGLHPKYYFDIIGKKAKRDLKKGDRLALDCVEGL